MNDIKIWIVLGLVSAIMGVFSRIAAHNEKSKPWWFFEWWRDFVSYFIAGLIGYYFINVRWSHIYKDGSLTSSDVILFAVFIVAILGWLPYVVKFFTQSVEKIVAKILK